MATALALRVSRFFSRATVLLVSAVCAPVLMRLRYVERSIQYPVYKKKLPFLFLCQFCGFSSNAVGGTRKLRKPKMVRE